MATHRFSWDNVEFDVEYTFWEGYSATREEPGADDFVEIEAISLNGVEISGDAFSDAFMKAAEAEILADILYRNEEAYADSYEGAFA